MEFGQEKGLVFFYQERDEKKGIHEKNTIVGELFAISVTHLRQ